MSPFLAEICGVLMKGANHIWQGEYPCFHGDFGNRVIEGEGLRLQLSPLEKLAACWPSPKALLSQVESIEFVENLWTTQVLQGVRAPGTAFPYVVLIGVMRRLKTKDFCVVKRKKPGVIINFSSGNFQRWIYTLDGSRHAEEQILAGLA